MIHPGEGRAEQVEDLNDLYENAPCGYLSLNPQGLIVKSNATLSSWLGFPTDQLVGKRLRDLLNVAGSIFYETHFAPLLRMQGFFNEVALDLVTADGGLLPVLANAVEKRDAVGALVFTRVTLFQATKRRRYERELVDAQEAERKLGKLRDQFIAVLGHDLRNPVAALNAGVQMLLKEPQSERSLHVIGLMQGSLARVSELIDNVMDLARSQSGGGIRLSRDASAPLGPVLHQVIEELEAAHPQRSIEAEINLTEPVDCDRRRIAQLVSNLLSNAITHGASDRPVRLHAETTGKELVLAIANHGEPIPEEVRSHLFQPFFRGSTSSSQQGLGLGLHIASEIARAHAGSLGVQSLEDEVRFTFRMPLA
ncbi:MAG: PAS domain-containing sensor histidine kinase [Alphaproteobacteria bacterium]|nr:PAS domain-containing sensor histidine kinase [Alphaproteobacteria bacterium]MBU0805368.1 PAS domain-containing sensor histidine kinase [Alphaproteobacteria bacterium]MBU0873314.1 PAS domain-containing sensor histidine kinase [Alphaproteobacteria bacterium]MBU1401458.1 PAS domain-containing sensor histidine kinase [Alphaproteobacteria bacterium]MBU1592125.1 PAS domain-containing sensor histidine kinase [Alphaproteobacteria bacterium]